MNSNSGASWSERYWVGSCDRLSLPGSEKYRWLIFFCEKACSKIFPMTNGNPTTAQSKTSSELSCYWSSYFWPKKNVDTRIFLKTQFLKISQYHEHTFLPVFYQRLCKARLSSSEVSLVANRSIKIEFLDNGSERGILCVRAFPWL